MHPMRSAIDGTLAPLARDKIAAQNAALPE
jgi:hypothetical protein